MPLKKDVRQHHCMWRVQVPAGVCLDHSKVNNIPTDVRTSQITQGKQLYIQFSCKRCDGESINWLLSPFYEIANNCGITWKIIDMFLLTEMLETTLEFSLNLTKKWRTDKQAYKQIMLRPTSFRGFFKHLRRMNPWWKQEHHTGVQIQLSTNMSTSDMWSRKDFVLCSRLGRVSASPVFDSACEMNPLYEENNLIIVKKRCHLLSLL